MFLYIKCFSSQTKLTFNKLINKLINIQFIKSPQTSVILVGSGQVRNVYQMSTKWSKTSCLSNKVDLIFFFNYDYLYSQQPNKNNIVPLHTCSRIPLCDLTYCIHEPSINVGIQQIWHGQNCVLMQCLWCKIMNVFPCPYGAFFSVHQVHK